MIQGPGSCRSCIPVQIVLGYLSTRLGIKALLDLRTGPVPIQKEDLNKGDKDD